MIGRTHMRKEQEIEWVGEVTRSFFQITVCMYIKKFEQWTKP